MSPNWGPRKEVRLGGTGMSSRELRRVEVLARVQAEELKLIDAASLMGVSYRQAKRIGERYREEGAEGMKHRSALSSGHRSFCWPPTASRVRRSRSSFASRDPPYNCGA